MAFGMTACSTTTTQSGTSSTTESGAAESGNSESAEPITLHYIYLEDRGASIIADLIYGAVDSFNESNEFNATVETEFIGTDQYWTKMAALSAAKTMPDVLFMSPNQRCFDYAEAGSVIPLDSYLDADPEWRDSFVEGAFSSITYEDSIYAVPLYKSSGAIFYNKEMFEAAGIEKTPETWDEFLEVCQKLQDAGYQPIAMAAQDPDTWCTSLFTGYLVQRIGGIQPLYDIRDRVDGYTFNQDCFIQAGQMTVDLIDKGYISETCPTTNNTEATAQVANGEAAMVAQLTSTISILEADDSLVKGKIGAFAFPTVEGGTGANMWMSKYSCMAIGAQCEHPEAAVGLLKEFTKEEIEINYAEQSGNVSSTQVEVNIENCVSEMADIVAAQVDSEGDFPYYDEMLGTTIGNEWNSTLGAICAKVKTPEKAFEDLQAFTEMNG